VKFQFSSPLWLWQGKGAWHFVTLPEDLAGQIAFFAGEQKAFGSVAVKATCGKTEWQTSLFRDKKSGSFLLPVKADVRKAEGLHAGDIMKVEIVLVRSL
jgi:hypothetical protein